MSQSSPTDKHGEDHAKLRAVYDQMKRPVTAGTWANDTYNQGLWDMMLAASSVCEQAYLTPSSTAAAQKTDDEELANGVLKLTATVRYLVGIAERGEGRPMLDDETAEPFVLRYVQRLEQELHKMRVPSATTFASEGFVMGQLDKDINDAIDGLPAIWRPGFRDRFARLLRKAIKLLSRDDIHREGER